MNKSDDTMSESSNSSDDESQNNKYSRPQYVNGNPCTDNLVEEINGRLLARTLATGNIDVLIDPRPTPTSYTRPLQNIIPPAACNSRVLQYNTNTANTFNPGDRKGAWSGFTANVNTESILRNQMYALQKFPQAQYAPNSTSDLYNSTMPISNTSTAQGLFPNLFGANLVQQKSDTPGNPTVQVPFEPIPVNLGNKLFNNHTRQQLKDN